MCGLIGWVQTGKNMTPDKTAAEFVAEQYEEQYQRGQKGFGLTEIHDDGTVKVLRATEPIKFLVDLKMSKAKHIIAHHRQPTSTDNEIGQTHPIPVMNEELQYDWLVHHNGVIRNATELKKKHVELKYEYFTAYEQYYTGGTNTYEKFNDSEAFAIELVRYLENKSPEIDVVGTVAFIAVKMKDNKVVDIVIGRNDGNPLEIMDYGYGNIFASALDYGDKVEAERAITFRAIYGKKSGKLIEFKKLEDTPELIFHKEIKTVVPDVPARNVYAHADDDDDDNLNWARTMGFGVRGRDDERTGGAPADVKKQMNDLERHTEAYGDHHTIKTCHKAEFHIYESRKHMAEYGHKHTALECSMPEFHHVNALPPAAAPAKKEEVTFLSVFDALHASKIGDVFRDADAQAHEAIAGFDLGEFSKSYAEGDIDTCDEMWDKYLEGFSEVADYDEVVKDAIDIEIEFTECESEEDFIKAAKIGVNLKMSKLAEQLNPLFKLQAFMEAALYIGFKLQSTQAEGGPSEGVIIIDPTDEEIEESGNHAFDDKKEDNKEFHMSLWPKGHKISQCKHPEFHSDLKSIDLKPFEARHEEFWGAGHNSVHCKMPEFHQSKTAADTVAKAIKDLKDKETLPTPREIHFSKWGQHTVDQCGTQEFHAKRIIAKPMDSKESPSEEAETALQILAENAEQMESEHILSEATWVSDQIQRAAVLEIGTNLGKLGELAGEHGMKIQIPFYLTKMNDVVDAAGKRFNKLAEIVSYARDKDAAGAFHL